MTFELRHRWRQCMDVDVYYPDTKTVSSYHLSHVGNVDTRHDNLAAGFVVLYLGGGYIVGVTGRGHMVEVTL